MPVDFAKIELSQNQAVPVYQRLCEWIEENILSGALPAGTVMPGIYVLAQQTGISPMTIRQAYRKLQESGLLSMQQGRGTFVTEISRVRWKRREEVRRTVNVGVLMFEVDVIRQAPFCMPIFSGIGEVCHPLNIRSHLFSVTGKDLGVDENIFVRELIRTKALDGLLIGGPLSAGDIETLQIVNLPFVLLDNDPGGKCAAPQVLIDDHAAMRLMLERLWGRKLTRVALLAGEEGAKGGLMIRRARKMAEAYHAWGKEKRIGLPPEYCAFCAYDPGEAEKTVAHMLRCRPRPEAIIVNGDALTVGALRAASGCGVQIFNYADADNSPAAFCVKPWRMMGKRAMEILRGMLEGDSANPGCAILEAHLREEGVNDN